MKKLALIARVLVGLVFVVFGANYFLGFLPLPEGTEASRAFGAALARTDYMWPLIKVTEIAAGLMVLTGIWVPLGLVLLAPIVVNIAFYNVLLDPAGMPMGIALVVLMLLLAMAYRESFRGLFRIG
ncbi:DoxX family membrane protein [Engelhardtia mirabilis]|uniref:DoxX n=1 Tax=Engelhardtia mirabilis TaxID=2528011 RepID=A0A518BDS2_9BACT|nr:DoxX [Planctomycetes bacterium Pla133]QDU99359.1 DoxX [Planctomycetes bacterium Pla86]